MTKIYNADVVLLGKIITAEVNLMPSGGSGGTTDWSEIKNNPFENSEPSDFEVAGALSGHLNAFNHGNIANGQTAYGWGNHAIAGYELSSNKGALNGYAPLVNGVVPINYMSPSVIERLVKVADETARFNLTITEVQNGDSVKQMDTGQMFYVVDDTQLDAPEGYEEYTVGIAGAVEWSDILHNPFGLNQPSDFEAAFSKNTAFNKNFGSTAGTVAEGNHTHSYVPLVTSIDKEVTTFNGTTGLLQSGSGIKMVGGKIYTTGVDGVDAIRIMKADGVTLAFQFDTLNNRLGIGVAPGSNGLNVIGIGYYSASLYANNGNTVLSNQQISGAFSGSLLIGNTSANVASALELRSKNIEFLRGLPTQDINTPSGKYFYQSASPTADTVNDTRFYNNAGTLTFQKCTVANATKGGGTWVNIGTM